MGKPTVLIVEDDHNLSDAVGRVAEQSGCPVIFSRSFQQAVERTRAHKIDIAICDWDLTNQGSGVDIGRELQQKHPKLLLVFITGKSARDLQTATTDLNVHSIIEKPFDLEVLRSLFTDLTEIYSCDR